MRTLLFLAALLFAPPALADDTSDDDLFSAPAKKGPDSVDVKGFSDTDDIDMPTFTAVAAVKPKPAETKPAGPGKLPVDVSGKEILADNFAPTVAFTATDAVVVDIPVYYAKSRKEFDGTTYWLVAEVLADGKKVAEGRAMVSADAVAATGPSVQFFRLFAPVGAPSGVLEIAVSKVVGTAKPALLFKRTVQYKI